MKSWLWAIALLCMFLHSSHAIAKSCWRTHFFQATEQNEKEEAIKAYKKALACSDVTLSQRAQTHMWLGIEYTAGRKGKLGSCKPCAIYHFCQSFRTKESQMKVGRVKFGLVQTILFSKGKKQAVAGACPSFTAKQSGSGYRFELHDRITHKPLRATLTFPGVTETVTLKLPKPPSPQYVADVKLSQSNHPLFSKNGMKISKAMTQTAQIAGSLSKPQTVKLVFHLGNYSEKSFKASFPMTSTYGLSGDLQAACQKNNPMVKGKQRVSLGACLQRADEKGWFVASYRNDTLTLGLDNKDRVLIDPVGKVNVGMIVGITIGGAAAIGVATWLIISLNRQKVTVRFEQGFTAR